MIDKECNLILFGRNIGGATTFSMIAIDRDHAVQTWGDDKKIYEKDSLFVENPSHVYGLLLIQMP